MVNNVLNFKIHMTLPLICQSFNFIFKQMNTIIKKNNPTHVMSYQLYSLYVFIYNEHHMKFYEITREN